MPSVNLEQRALVNVTGEDAEKLLQNVITTDLDALKPRELKPGALLTPQGKILFDFLVSRIENGIRIEIAEPSAADLVKRLVLYRLRSKADISVENESPVSVCWERDSASSEIDSSLIVGDTRFPARLNVRRIYAASKASASLQDWDSLRIAHGAAESPRDFALSDAFPHDINLDQTGGVAFTKGCFIGQEVVSRMQHRGTARRRILIASSETALPDTGTPITANGREIGTLGTVVGTNGLALARIDRVKDAMDSKTPILAGDIPVTLSIPPEVRFTFPETEGSDAG
ncbi:MAG: YgfZ/GcvT domain-containing protein [Phyllobacterium sp.]